MALVTQFRKAFTDHPASVDETYVEHFRVATHYSRELAGASLKALVHAFVPGMCCTSASEKIKQLHAEVTTGHRAELAEAARAQGEVNRPTPAHSVDSIAGVG
jgi:hypothetical protein